MASSLASTPSWKYDVFLSFRGEDTRRDFTDHLHERLKRYGIMTFIDDQLRRGDQISPALLQAIEDSRFSVVIFSKNYASSSWCLDELTKILECVDKGKHTAFPVFCEVDPSHVRHQRGSYEEAFRQHEEAHTNNMEKVDKWRQALNRVSGYSGWDTRDRHHSEVIKEIVSKIFNKIQTNPSSSNKIGMDSRIEAVLSLLCIGSPDVRMVGIWGMAGVGKTTLAEAIYQRIHSQYEGYCFLSNVREKSQTIENLQMELLSKILQEENLGIRDFRSDYIRRVLHSKQVLIVLDDVNHIKQLEQLAGHRDWFGPKSRIIITTRDKRLLIEKEVDEIYLAKELQNREARMLFCLHAFKAKPPIEDFKELCDRFLHYTKGNPLAIKILGCLLYKRTKKEWECELEKLKKFPNKDIQEVLRISFDGLEDIVKNIFLDIVCFFKEKDKDYVSKILKGCDFYPEIGIPTLIERALITISYNNKLCMHDLIQEMGWEIVRQQSIEFPGRRSRLWLNEDVEDVLMMNSGTETIQAIVFDLSTSKDLLDFNADAFTKMAKVRLFDFHIKKWRYYFGGKKLSAPYKMHLRGDFKFPSKNLVYLRWEGYPLESLPSNFNPNKLFELNMSFSRLENLWQGCKLFRNLEYMDLRHSRDLIRTPDLTGAPKLKKINLEGCTSLVEVHSSIETLKKLSFLNLSYCSNLEKVAESFGKLTSLDSVDFFSCSKLRKLPNDLKISTTLLDLSSCSNLEELPNSIGGLTSLLTLKLRYCSKVKKLPDDIGRLQHLEQLVAYGSGIQELPHSITSLCLLRNLDLRGNSFISLPSLTPLIRLSELRLDGCKHLRALTELPSSFKMLSASYCISLETFSYPPSTYENSNSRELMLDFSNCGRLLENEESLKAILDGIWIVPRFSQYRSFGAVVPGSNISEWFIHRSEGNSIIVKLPPDFHDLKEVGLGFCVVLPQSRSPWHSDHHLWFGYNAMISNAPLSRACRFMFSLPPYDKTLSKRVSHLKFSFPPEVEECGIRLLYSPVKSEENWNGEMIIERETVNATIVSPPPTLIFYERCWKTTVRAKYPNLERSLLLLIEVEGFNIHAPQDIMATSLTRVPNQYEVISHTPKMMRTSWPAPRLKPIRHPYSGESLKVLKRDYLKRIRKRNELLERSSDYQTKKAVVMQSKYVKYN